MARSPVGAYALNAIQLDNGTCGQHLQIGSNITASSVHTPSFLLNGDGGLSSYRASIDGSTIGTFNSNGVGQVCIYDTETLTDGSHQLTVSELAPNPSNIVNPFNFTVDTTPLAAPSQPSLDPVSDSGIKGDDITNFTSPRLDGTSVPDVPIRIIEGGRLVGGALAGPTGYWTAITDPLVSGINELAAATVNEAGVQSAPSPPLSLDIISTAPPAPPAPTLDSLSGSDSVATTQDPGIDGTDAEPVDSITVFVNGVMAGTTSSDQSGNWSLGLSGLTDGQYLVTATDTDVAGNTSPPSQALDLTVAATPATVPGAPSVTATAGSGSVTLSWSVPTNGGSAISAYDVYRGTAPGAETLLNTVSTSSDVDTSVTNGTTYYYEVSAINGAGQSGRSLEVAATPATVPGAPSVTATAGSGSVTLSWSQPTNGGSAISAYDVYRGTAPGAETLLNTVSTSSDVDTSVTNGTTYYYEVSAINGAGQSGRSLEVAATPATVPGAPSVTATAGSGSVTLSWSQPTNGGSAISAYDVYRGTAPGAETLLNTVSTSSDVDTSVTNGTTYYYEVSAINGAGQSGRSLEVAATPAASEQAPKIMSSRTIRVATRHLFTFTVVATGFPDPIFFEEGALPPGVTFDGTTGELSGIPASGSSGSYRLLITATNSVGSADQKLIVRVTKSRHS